MSGPFRTPWETDAMIKAEDGWFVVFWFEDDEGGVDLVSEPVVFWEFRHDNEESDQVAWWYERGAFNAESLIDRRGECLGCYRGDRDKPPSWMIREAEKRLAAKKGKG